MQDSPAEALTELPDHDDTETPQAEAQAAGAAALRLCYDPVVFGHRLPCVHWESEQNGETT